MVCLHAMPIFGYARWRASEHRALSSESQGNPKMPTTLFRAGNVLLGTRPIPGTQAACLLCQVEVIFRLFSRAASASFKGVIS